MRLLWIVPKWPFPPEDGARFATVSLLSSLTGLGESIDLVALAGADEVVDSNQAKHELGVEEVYVIRRAARAKTSWQRVGRLLYAFLTDPFTPITMQPYRAGSVRRTLTKLLDDNTLASADKQWDVMVYDGLHPAIHSARCGTFMRPKSFREKQIVYRAHNREAGIWERKAAQTTFPPFRWFLAFQASRVQAFEQSLIEEATSVAAVSAEDLRNFREYAPGAVGSVVPIGYEFESPPRAANNDGLQVLFLGKLDWPPNRDGLRWFLEKVWPTVAENRPELSLTIAGSGSPKGLEPHFSKPRVRFLGRVDSVEAVYRDSFLSLVPVFYGSGTRVKAIEASRFARPCLSTEIGVEGIGLRENESYFRGETEAEWIRVLSELDPDRARAVGEAAYRIVAAGFNARGTAERFQDLIR